MAPPKDKFDHALNNILCRIVAAAELALDGVTDAQARAEIEGIIVLAQEGAELVAFAKASGAVD